MSRHRRRVLRLLAAGVTAGTSGAAGYLGRPPGTAPGPGSSPPTTTPDDGFSTATPPGTVGPPAETVDLGEPFDHPDGWSPTLTDARVHRIELQYATHVDPVAVPGGQYVRYRVTASGDANGSGRGGVLPDPSRLLVTLDGADATPNRRGFWSGRRDAPDADHGTMVTPVRVATADRAALRWRRPDGDVAWRLPSGVREAIAHPPAFEVRAFEVPGKVAAGSTFDVGLTVANVGERDGRFLAELGATAISDAPELRFEVPAGEAVRHVEAVEPYVPEDADELRLVLHWGAGRLERTVAVA